MLITNAVWSSLTVAATASFSQKSDAKIDPNDHDVHHAFIVAEEEYETAKDELRAKGINIFLEEDRQGGAVNGPRAYFHDPDGNVLEIINLTSYKGKIS